MNYPHIEHLCHVARFQRVLWVGETMTQVRHTFNAIARLNPEGVKLRRTNGEERIDFPDAGSIQFATRRNYNDRVRGWQFEHVFLDDHRYLDDERFRQTLAPCFPHGERYSVIA